MPYATYQIKKDLFNNLSNIDFENLDHFLKNINSLNKKKRAILVDDEDNNIINILNNKINNLEKEREWKEFTYDPRFADKKTLLFKEKLIECLRTFKESTKCFVDKKLQENIVLDFVKDEKNQFDDNIIDKYNDDIIYPENFNLEAEKFKKHFLDKIKVLILSSVSAEKRTKGFKKKINGIGIIHKELSNYLLPDYKSLPSKKEEKETGISKENILDNFFNKSIEENMKNPNCGYIQRSRKSFFVENVKKTEGGNKLLLNWWNELPDAIKPAQFIIITDIPSVIPYNKKREYIKLSQLRFEEFMFKEMKKSEFKPRIEFVDRRNLKIKWNWTHKKHLIFGQEVSLLVYSDFGGEFIKPNIYWDKEIEHWIYKSYKEDEKELKLNPSNKFYIIKENTFDLKQIKELIKEKKWF